MRAEGCGQTIDRALSEALRCARDKTKDSSNHYRFNWKLLNIRGRTFGMNDMSDTTIYVEIDVENTN